MDLLKSYVLKHTGYYPICETTATFTAVQPWLRDHFFVLVVAQYHVNVP